MIANERNEMDTALVLSSKLGDGVMDGLRPVEVRVTGDVSLVTDTGPVSARGLSYLGDPLRDSSYLTSTVRLVSAKLWDVASNPEDFPHPLWPLPSSVEFFCRNNTICRPTQMTAPASTLARATFSGGVTTNGVASIMPGNRNVFRVTRAGGEPLVYLGLADLGQTTGDSVASAYDYEQVRILSMIELKILLVTGWG